MNELDGMHIERVDAPVRRQVEDAIRMAIVDGHFKPEQRLVEEALCKRLTVSRSIIREALRQLVAEGLVVIVPHHGARVASVNCEEARQIYEVRAQLEALAGRGFAIHADESALNALKSVVADLERAAADESSGRSVLAIKQRFYEILLAHCGNQIVREVFQRLNNRISLLRSLSLSQSGRLPATVHEIRQLINALERRDPAAAHEACLLHVENAAANALRTLSARESDSV
jgi:DNA-binding GntR family transcriptional regulator